MKLFTRVDSGQQYEIHRAGFGGADRGLNASAASFYHELSQATARPSNLLEMVSLSSIAALESWLDNFVRFRRGAYSMKGPPFSNCCLEAQHATTTLQKQTNNASE